MWRRGGLALALLVPAMLLAACRTSGPAPAAPTAPPATAGQASPVQGQAAPAAGGQESPAGQTVNGITFQADPGGLGCPVALTDAAEAEVRASPMAFTATYLPEGYSFQYELAASCQGRVVSIGQVFAGPNGMLNIGRWATHTASLPAAEPQAVTVAGKPAVKIGTGADLFLAEEFGMTEIAGTGLDYGEIVKVAEGLRPR